MSHNFTHGKSIIKNSVKIVLCIVLLLVLVHGVQAAETYQFVTKWGTNGTADGQFFSPADVEVDKSGNVYIADKWNNRIQKFSPTGAFLGKWGTYGSGDGQFNGPMGVAVDTSGNVYVADRYNFRIQKFSPDGTFITKWGTDGRGDGQFKGPECVAVDSSGNVYIADNWNNRIQKFDSSGTFLSKWGSIGPGDGQFQAPAGVTVDSSGNVYVADAFSNSHIQKFSSTGTFITRWGTGGSGDGQFESAYGVAVDSSNNVFVADIYNNRIQKFSSTGTFLTMWGSLGDGNGQFNWPTGVAVDSSGNIYVADTGNNRIQKFAIQTTTPISTPSITIVATTQPTTVITAIPTPIPSPITKPVADFTGVPTSGAAPLTVKFDDESTVSGITSRVWQYKLNSDSKWTTFNPDGTSSFTFMNTGTYDIQLTVTGTGGSNTKTKLNYIKTDQTCKVELRSKGAIINWIPYIGRHNRIIFSDEKGTKTIFEGRPMGMNGWKGWSLGQCDQKGFMPPYGQLYVSIITGDNSDTAGYDPPYFTLEGKEMCDKYACFKQLEATINDDCIEYNVFGPNSNSVAYTLLDSCGLPTPNPRLSLGWESVF